MALDRSPEFWEGLRFGFFFFFCGFSEEEEVWRTVLPPYGTSSPHSPQACLLTDQNLANNLWKRLPKEHFCEIISKSDVRFMRISSCPYSAKSPHSPKHFLLTDQIFTNTSWKGSLKEHSWEIISKLDLLFQRRSFFKYFSLSPCLAK